MNSSSKIIILSFAFFFIFPLYANAALIINRPLYIGLANGLVGYWSFDGPDVVGSIVYDRSSSNASGTFNGNVTQSAGRIGQGLYFGNGADNYVDISPSPAGVDDMDLQGEAGMTISFWKQSTEANVIITKGVFGNSGFWNLLSRTDVNGKPSLNFGKDYAGADDLNAVYDATDAPNHEDGAWHHLVLTWDGSATAANVRFYVDGINYPHDPNYEVNGAGSKPSDADLDVTLGGVSGNNGLNGIFDDVRFYNRVLSADEIKRLYNIGSTFKINKPANTGSLQDGLVGYWSFDGPDVLGSTVFDRSGQRNDGALADGPIPAAGKIGQALNFDGVNDFVGQAGSVSFDNATNSSDMSGSSSGSFSHTTSGTNRYLVCGFSGWDSSNNLQTLFSNGTATYNGADMAELGFEGDAGMNSVILFGLINPFAGSNLVEWSLSGGVMSELGGGCVSFKNVHQVFPVGAFASAVDNTVDITLSSGDMGVDILYGNTGGSAPSVGGQDLRVDEQGPAGVWHMMSTEAGTGVVTMSWTGVTDDAIGAIPIKAGASVGSGMNIGNVSTVSFWAKPTSVTQSIIDLNGTANIDISSGTVRGNNIASSTIYVDGVQTATFPDTGWHHIAITTNIAVDANALIIGLISSSYYNGLLDDVRVYSRAFSQDEIKRLYNIGSTFKINKPANTGSLAQGLVGYWSFDGPDMTFDGTTLTAYDRSGNNNNGTSTGLNMPTRVAGRIGQALEFDGVDDYVEKTSALGLPTTQGSFSIRVYLKSKPVSPYSYPFIDLSDGTTNNGVSFYIDFSKLYIYVSSGGSGVNVWSLDQSTININQWYHFVATWDTATDIYQVYSNGYLITPGGTDVAGNPSGINQIDVGSFFDHSSGNFHYGLLDDVRIYNRVLSPDEIKRLYNMGR